MSSDARVLPVLIALLVGAAPATWAQGLSPDGRLTVTAAANGAIQRYVEQVSGRFGALAVSQDGNKAVSYICQSRLWKNCDEPGSDDSNIAIPSGKIARDEALTRCRSPTPRSSPKGGPEARHKRVRTACISRRWSPKYGCAAGARFGGENHVRRFEEGHGGRRHGCSGHGWHGSNAGRRTRAPA